MKKIGLEIFFLIVLISFSFFLYYFFLKSNEESVYQYQLAGLANIELNAVRQWAGRKGLKNNLSSGDRGEEVKILQQALAAEPGVVFGDKISGVFNEATRQAVAQFQQKYGIPADGAVGPVTRQKLNEIYLKELCPKPSKAYSDMSLALLDKIHNIPPDYVPSDLVDISQNVKTSRIICLKSSVLPYLEKMFKDAKKEGLTLAVTSGYRRFEIQKLLYEYGLSVVGEKTLDLIAFPGHSEHQLGTTVDLTGQSLNYRGIDLQFGSSPEGKWLVKNAHKYGFVLSYPRGKKKITGYDYEPWHFRFVGPEIAEIVSARKITFPEYLSSIK